MPVRALPFDAVVDDLRDRELDWLGRDVPWFDAHTHIGHHDPDGFEADPEELIEALDAAGQQRALVFAMQEPDGYRGPNDWVLRSARGVRRAAGRAGPDRPQRARRDGGGAPLPGGRRASASSCTRASDAFGLPHPVVEQVVALAGEHSLPVLFHAGRGIPDLGESILEMSAANPDARLILAHAGICDLGLLGPRVAEHPGPALRHVVVAHQRHADAVHDRAARADPVRVGHALRRPALPVVPDAALRAGGGAERPSRPPRSPAGSWSAWSSGSELMDLGPAPGDGRHRPPRAGLRARDLLRHGGGAT